MPSRGHRRALALASTVLFVGALLAAHHHRAYSHHGYCSEHGELIHIDAPGASLERIDPTRPRLHAAPAAHGAHDCPILRLLSQQITAARQARCRTAAALAPLRPAARGSYHRAVAILHLSPKNSPPLA